jgi:DNA-directed RNA polymerase specialized sigma24 family protein
VLWRHVAGLSERCRYLLRVIAFADRPDYAAIAEALGMPVGSIGPTRGRCLAALRAALVLDPAYETGELS